MFSPLIRILFFLIMTINFGCNNSTDSELLIGEWNGMDHKQNLISVVFNRDMSVYLVQNNFAVGGDLYADSGNLKLKYELNTQKRPHDLDLVIWDTRNCFVKKRVQGIFRFLSNNRIELRLSFTGLRHTGFNSQLSKARVLYDTETIILERKFYKN